MVNSNNGFIEITYQSRMRYKQNFILITFFFLFHLLATGGSMPEKNAALVVKLHKCHIFEKALPL